MFITPSRVGGQQLLRQDGGVKSRQWVSVNWCWLVQSVFNHRVKSNSSRFTKTEPLSQPAAVVKIFMLKKKKKSYYCFPTLSPALWHQCSSTLCTKCDTYSLPPIQNLHHIIDLHSKVDWLHTSLRGLWTSIWPLALPHRTSESFAKVDTNRKSLFNWLVDCGKGGLVGSKCPWSPSVQAGCFSVRQDSQDIFTHTINTYKHTHTHMLWHRLPLKSTVLQYIPITSICQDCQGEDPAAKLPHCSFWTCRPTTISSARGGKTIGPPGSTPKSMRCIQNPTLWICSFEAVKPPSIPDAPIRLAWPAKLRFYAFVSLRNHSGIKCWSEVRKKRKKKGLSQANEILAHYNLPNVNGFCTGAGPKAEGEDASKWTSATTRRRLINGGVQRFFVFFFIIWNLKKKQKNRHH